MKNAIEIIFSIILMLVLLTSCKRLEFIKIEAETNEYQCKPIDDEMLCKSEHFIIKGFRNKQKIETQIDEFVCNYAIPESKKYRNFSITFYKSSYISNINYIKRNRDNWAVYAISNDYLWTYEFEYKKGFERKFRLKGYNDIMMFFKEPKCLMESKDP